MFCEIDCLYFIYFAGFVVFCEIIYILFILQDL